MARPAMLPPPLHYDGTQAMSDELPFEFDCIKSSTSELNKVHTLLLVTNRPQGLSAAAMVSSPCDQEPRRRQ